ASNQSAFEEIRRRQREEANGAARPQPNGPDPAPAGGGNGKDPHPSPDVLGPIIAAYDYTDESGRLRFQVTGHAWPEKTFRQRRPDGNGGWIDSTKGIPMVPYHLPELIEAIAFQNLIWIVEGERDVETLMKLGTPATTNPRGAGKWGNCDIDS